MASLVDLLGRFGRGLMSPKPLHQKVANIAMMRPGIQRPQPSYQQDTPDNRVVVSSSPSGYQQMSAQKVPKKLSLEQQMREQLEGQMGATTKIAEEKTFNRLYDKSPDYVPPEIRTQYEEEARMYPEREIAQLRSLQEARPAPATTAQYMAQIPLKWLSAPTKTGTTGASEARDAITSGLRIGSFRNLSRLPRFVGLGNVGATTAEGAVGGAMSGAADVLQGAPVSEIALQGGIGAGAGLALGGLSAINIARRGVKPVVPPEVPPGTAVAQASPSVAPTIVEPQGPSRFGTFQQVAPEPVAPRPAPAPRPVAPEVRPVVPQPKTAGELYRQARAEAQQGVERGLMPEAERGVVRKGTGVAPEPTSLRKSVLEAERDKIIEQLPKSQRRWYRQLDDSVQNGKLTAAEAQEFWNTVQRTPEDILERTIIREYSPIMKRSEGIGTGAKGKGGVTGYIKKVAAGDKAVEAQMRRGVAMSEWGRTAPGLKQGIDDIAIGEVTAKYPGMVLDTLYHELSHKLAGVLPSNIRNRINRRLSQYVRSQDFENAVRAAGYPDPDTAIRSARADAEEAFAHVYALEKHMENGRIPDAQTPLRAFMDRIENPRATTAPRGMKTAGKTAAAEVTEQTPEGFVIPEEQILRFREQEARAANRFGAGEAAPEPAKTGFVLSEEQQAALNRLPRRAETPAPKAPLYREGPFLVGEQQRAQLQGGEPPSTVPGEVTPGAGRSSAPFIDDIEPPKKPAQKPVVPKRATKQEIQTGQAFDPEADFYKSQKEYVAENQANLQRGATSAQEYEALFGEKSPAGAFTKEGEINKLFPGETKQDAKLRVEEFNGEVFMPDGRWNGGRYFGDGTERARKQAIQQAEESTPADVKVQDQEVVRVSDSNESIITADTARQKIKGLAKAWFENENAHRAFDVTMRDGREHTIGDSLEVVEALMGTKNKKYPVRTENWSQLMDRYRKETQKEFGYEPNLQDKQKWYSPITNGLARFTMQFKQLSDISQTGGKLLNDGMQVAKKVAEDIEAVSKDRLTDIAKKHGLTPEQLKQQYIGTDKGKAIIRAADGWSDEFALANRADDAELRKTLTDQAENQRRIDQEMLKNDPVAQDLFLYTRRATDLKVLLLNVLDEQQAKWIGFIPDYFTHSQKMTLDELLEGTGYQEMFQDAAMRNSPEELALLRKRFVNDPELKRRFGAARLQNDGDFTKITKRQSKSVGKFAAEPYFQAARQYGIENLPQYAQNTWGRVLNAATGKNPITLGKFGGDAVRATFSNLIPGLSMDGLYTLTATAARGGGILKTVGGFLKNMADIKGTGKELIEYALNAGDPKFAAKVAKKMGLDLENIKGFDPYGLFSPEDQFGRGIEMLPKNQQRLAKNLQAYTRMMRQVGMLWKWPGGYIAAAAQRNAKQIFEAMADKMKLTGDAKEFFVRENLTKANTSDVSVNFAPIETTPLGRTMTQFASPAQKQLYGMIEKGRRGVEMYKLAQNIEKDAAKAMADGRPDIARQLYDNAAQIKGKVNVTAKDFAAYATVSFLAYAAMAYSGIREDVQLTDVLAGQIGPMSKRVEENVKKLRNKEISPAEYLVRTISDLGRGLGESHVGAPGMEILNVFGYESLAQEVYGGGAEGPELAGRALITMLPPTQMWRTYVSRNPLLPGEQKNLAEEAVNSMDMPEWVKQPLRPKMPKETREAISASYDITDEIAARRNLKKESVSNAIKAGADKFGTPPSDARGFAQWRNQVGTSVANELGLKTRSTGKGIVFLDPEDAYSVGYAINMERLRRLSHDRTDPYAASWGVISNASGNYQDQNAQARILLERYESLDAKGRQDFVKKLKDSFLLTPSLVTMRATGAMKKKDIGKLYNHLLKGMKKDQIDTGFPPKDLPAMTGLL